MANAHPLARCLHKLGRSQAWLARRAGLSAPYVSQVLSGARQKFNVEDARRIRRAVNNGVTLEQLVTPFNVPRATDGRVNRSRR